MKSTSVNKIVHAKLRYNEHTVDQKNTYTFFKGVIIFFKILQFLVNISKVKIYFTHGTPIHLSKLQYYQYK